MEGMLSRTGKTAKNYRIFFSLGDKIRLKDNYDIAV